MKRDEVLDILTRHRDQIRSLGVKRLALFGSTARNQSGPDSDVDLLVEMDRRRRRISWNPFSDVEDFLSDLLGRPVDISTWSTLKPFHKDNILAEAIEVYPRPTRPANYPPEDIVPRRSPRQRLQDMIESIDAVLDFSRDRSFADYLADRMFRKAVERDVEVISEASRHLPVDLKAAYPQIAWMEMRSIGNVLRHAYPDVDASVMWSTVTKDLPALRPVVEEMIAEVDRREGRA